MSSITEELTFSSVSFRHPVAPSRRRGARRGDASGGAVRTSRRLVLAQQSACFDPPAATRTQRNVFVLSRSAACWDDSGWQRASVGLVLGERLQVQKKRKFVKLQAVIFFFTSAGI